MKQSYEIEIRCPKIFHDFTKEHPESDGEYLLFFADTNRFTVADYYYGRNIFKYEDYEEFYEVYSTESDTFWAELLEAANFIEEYLI